MTEVREMTFNSGMSARLVSRSSWMPSAKKALLSLSSLMFSNGRTAMDLSDTAGRTGAASAAAAFDAGAATAVGGSPGRRVTSSATMTPTKMAAAPPHIQPGRPDFFAARVS